MWISYDSCVIVVLQENILTRIHKHLAHDVDEDSCQEQHCIPHQKFAMTVIEQVNVNTSASFCAIM